LEYQQYKFVNTVGDSDIRRNDSIFSIRLALQKSKECPVIPTSVRMTAVFLFVGITEKGKTSGHSGIPLTGISNIRKNFYYISKLNLRNFHVSKAQ